MRRSDMRGEVQHYGVNIQSDWANNSTRLPKNREPLQVTNVYVIHLWLRKFLNTWITNDVAGKLVRGISASSEYGFIYIFISDCAKQNMARRERKQVRWSQGKKR